MQQQRVKIITNHPSSRLQAKVKKSSYFGLVTIKFFKLYIHVVVLILSAAWAVPVSKFKSVQICFPTLLPFAVID